MTLFIYHLQVGFLPLVSTCHDLSEMSTMNKHTMCRCWTYGMKWFLLHQLDLNCLKGMLGGFVQGFFTWRIKVLTGNLILVSLILLCSASAFRKRCYLELPYQINNITKVMGIATSIAIRFVPHFAEFQRFKVVVIICKFIF